MVKGKGGGRFRPGKTNDELLKGAFEEYFVDFLRFLYPDADQVFDLSRAIQFMDKELLAIAPDRERREGRRIADLLAKVHLRDGGERWILLHTEIEGGSGDDFAYRMFQYHYRILDRYRVAVESIAVFTGGRGQPRPAVYHHQTLDTQIHFKYRVYHIYDHSEQELLSMNNIFALIVLACQKAQLEGKVAESELGHGRLTIAKALLSHQIEHDRIIGFLVFLKNFIYVTDREINRIFEDHIIQLTGGNIDMGIIEIVKRQERELGLEKGLEKGRREERAKAEAEKKAIALEMKKDGLSIDQIAKLIPTA